MSDGPVGSGVRCRAVSFLALIVFWWCSLCECASSVIVEKGKPLGAIVTPAQPTKAEQFAAEELQVYLRKMAGVEIPIVVGEIPAKKSAIVVGNHPVAEPLRRKLQKFSRDQEAFAVAGKGRRLHLVGNGESAILYAAWDWLESLGVRWVMPTERGEYVPKLERIAISETEKFDAPAMSFRGPNYSMHPSYSHPEDSLAQEHGISASALFSFRMRLNNNVTFDNADNWTSIGSGHSYFYFLPVERYFQDHPEWFHVLNGKRNGGADWQICFTNREAAKEFAKNVVGAIRHGLKQGLKVERMRLCVSPNDWRAWCECADCQKLVDDDGLATSMVTHFANMVAEAVRKEFPTARIIFYAYDNYTRPPDRVKPGPGVAPELVFWTWSGSVGANNAQPMFSDANDKYRRYFRQWADLCDGISSHEYYGHYTWFTPWPKLTQMAQDIRTMVKEPKFYGMYSESHLHWGTQAPNFYLQPKLMWNPSLDVQKTLDDFYRAGFGPAAAFIKAHYELLQKRMDSIGYICGYLTEVPQLLTPEVVQQCDELMGKAEARMPQMDANMRWRTDLVVQAWRTSAKTAEAMRLFISPQDVSSDRQRILKNMEEVLQFAGTPLGKWAFEHRIVEGALSGYLATLRIPLNALPVGETAYNDYLSYGGTLKFWAKISGMEQGMWGYTVPAKGKGVIELPLQTVEGHRLKSVSLRLNWVVPDPAKFNASVSAIGDDGRVIPVASDITAASSEMTVPVEALGKKLTVRAQCENLTGESMIALTNFNLRVTIE